MSQHARNKKFFLEQIVIYEQELYAYLVSLTDQPQVAEDLLQNTMEKAWEKLGQLKVPKKARGWLFSIAKNEVNMYFRESEETCSYVDEVHGSYDENLDFVREKQDILEDLIKDFDVSIMRKALHLLESRHKTLIMMHYFQGMNQREIADALNQNRSTVRVNLVRALERVREIRKEIERGEGDATGKQR